MRGHVTTMALTIALGIGCGQGAAQSGSAATPQRRPSSAPRTTNPPFADALPATFFGDLPCNDCSGIRHTIDLYPDHTFVHRLAYIARGDRAQAAPVDDMGRWNASANGRTLILRGVRQARLLFEVKDARTLRLLDPAGMPIESTLNYDLARADRFEPLEPQLTLRGMYSYMADAGMFVDCATGWRLPVVTEGDNVAVERAYQASRTQPGEQVFVRLEARVAMRPRMEGGGAQRALVPVRFDAFVPGQTCESTAVKGTAPVAGGSALTGTGWRLVTSTIEVSPPEDVGRVTLKFTDRSLGASSGCNTGTGSYAVKDGTLAVQAFATTKKACPGVAGSWEPAFFRFLASGPALTHEGDALILMSTAAEMRFQSMPMPSTAALRKFVYVAPERKDCTGVASMRCLQVREKPDEPWRLFHGEIVGFTPEPGIEYRLRILEDTVPNAPPDAPSKRWFLDLIVERRTVNKP